MPEQTDQTISEINSRLVKETYEWAEAVVFSLAFVVLVFSLIFKIAGVSGVSMENTLNMGVVDEDQKLDRLIISDIRYTPKHGDIVVINTSNLGLIIKRVIGVEGDTVNIDFNKHIVYLNGKALSEPYTKEPTSLRADTVFPLTVQKGHVFVMGDNRNNSHDSRFSDIGQVDVHNIIGKAYFRIYPFSRFGPIK